MPSSLHYAFALSLVLHGVLHYEPATVALLGAATLLLVSGEDPHQALAEVEWSTIFFFIGLFIIIGGTVKVVDEAAALCPVSRLFAGAKIGVDATLA